MHAVWRPPGEGWSCAERHSCRLSATAAWQQTARRLTLIPRQRSQSSTSGSLTASATVEQQDSACTALNYKAIVAYDGTGYYGFQMQARNLGTTIQDRLERALGKITNQNRQALRLQAAGRTDSGVHARGQCISFFLPPVNMSTEQLRKGTNAWLPDAIRVLEVACVPPDFSARHTAVGKEYHYCVSTGEFQDPFNRKYAEHVGYKLDMDIIRSVATIFVGQHDFTQFANLPPPGEYRHPVKTLKRFDVVETADGFRLEIEGDGFLYKMVRHVTGALLKAGCGRLPVSTIEHFLSMGSSQPIGNRGRPWNIAGAKGLCLMRVDYPPHADLSTMMHPERMALTDVA